VYASAQTHPAQQLKLTTDTKHDSCSQSFHLPQGEIMNKDQVKGQIKDVAGKVQAEAGKLVGNTEQQAKGIKLQVEGKAQKGLGNAKELVKDTRQAAKDAAHS
jgi:uncharacterized protein YjbJ (UPF0337 family)